MIMVDRLHEIETSLQNRALHQFGGLSFPESLSGLKLTFIENVRRIEQEPYNPIPSIPSSFWSTRIIEQLPVTMFYRKRLMHEIFDLDHREICTNTVFHTFSNDLCTCKLCGDHAHPYHSKHCTWNARLVRNYHREVYLWQLHIFPNPYRQTLSK